jgi:group I intron endonuclease
MIGIYKITSPTGKIYIGQSVDINRRKTEYKSGCHRGKLYNSFNKHGFENHTFETLEECTLELLNERERHYQDFYDVLGPNGLNLVLTTTETSSGYLSNEVRQNMINGHKNKPLSEQLERRRKISETQQNRTEEEKTRLRKVNSNSLKNYYKTAPSEDIEFRNKRNSEAQKRKSYSEETIEKIRKKAVENKSDPEYIRKQKEGINKYFENLTLEQKLKNSNSISLGLKNRTREQKDETRKKLQETCRIKRELKLKNKES